MSKTTARQAVIKALPSQTALTMYECSLAWERYAIGQLAQWEVEEVLVHGNKRAAKERAYRRAAAERWRNTLKAQAV